MPRRKGWNTGHGNGDDDDQDRDPTIEEIAAIAGVGEAVPPLDVPIGIAPSGGDELTDEEIERRNREFELGRVVGPDIGSPDLMERMTKALEGLNERKEATENNQQFVAVIAMLADAINGLRTGQMQAAQLQADMQRRVTRPENAFPPQISKFNPRGDKDFPRPQLKCPMEIPWPVEQEAHTREEIELLNLIEAGEWMVTRSDRSKVKMVVTIARKLDSDVPSKLTILHDTAFNNDNHKLMPYDWIRQLVMANPKTKAAGAAVITMEEEEALIAARKFNDGTLAREDQHVVSVGA